METIIPLTPLLTDQLLKLLLACQSKVVGLLLSNLSLVGLRADTLWKVGIRPSTASIFSSFKIAPQLPFSRNHQFCGREDLLSKIRSTLERVALSGATEAQPMTRRVAVLHGLGGVGKSSIALEYSFRYSSSYTAVFWADATSGASFFRTARVFAEQLVAHYAREGISLAEISSFLRLGGLLDANGQIVAGEAEERRVAGAIKEWLSIENNGRWLLILDNYDIGAVNIHDLLPTCDTGHVIITSRRSDLHALGRSLEIVEMDEQSGISLFLKSANKEEVSEGGKYADQAVWGRKLILII